jgi:hypothetical protein
MPTTCASELPPLFTASPIRPDSGFQHIKWLSDPGKKIGHNLVRNSAGYFLRRSRISVRSFTSGVGPGGFGGSCVWSLLIPLIAMNNTHAMIKKFRVTVRN